MTFIERQDAAQIPAASTTVSCLRRHQRTPVAAHAVLYSGSGFQSTVIRNFSEGGVGIEGATGVFVGDTVTVALPTGQSRSGKVRWWLNGWCGIQYDQVADMHCGFHLALLKKARLELP